MRAVRLNRHGDRSVLYIAEAGVPRPEPGQAQAKVRAAGTNPGGAAIRSGALASRLPATFPSGEGSDLAGGATRAMTAEVTTEVEDEREHETPGHLPEALAPGGRGAGHGAGRASLLAGRKNQTNLRALAVMNAMTMCAHQYEEYVDPGYFPGQVNVVIFKSGQPLNYPFNANAAMCANISFRALYVPAMLFPKVKWLGLPPVLLGITQALAHGGMSVVIARDDSRARYSPGP